MFVIVVCLIPIVFSHQGRDYKNITFDRCDESLQVPSPKAMCITNAELHNLFSEESSEAYEKKLKQCYILPTFPQYNYCNIVSFNDKKMLKQSHQNYIIKTDFETITFPKNKCSIVENKEK